MTLTFGAGDLYNCLHRKLSLLTSVQFHDYITRRWRTASAEHGTVQHIGVVLHDQNKTLNVH